MLNRTTCLRFSPCSVVIAGIVSILAGSATGNAEALKARVGLDDLVVSSVAGTGSSLVKSDGTRVPLPLPPTALVQSFMAAGETWYAAAVDVTAAGRRLLVLEGSGAKAQPMASPIVEDTAELREPSLLTGGSGLRGLAWIEGRAPRLQRVRLAAWSAEDGWQAPVTVSPVGAGSQMALATTRLDDGSWLLAWTAFDGNDDEVLWSRWTDGGLSPPVRLGAENSVPDITPRLWTTPGGALAAWSRSDGSDYRLHLARFDGSSWSQPVSIGPRGSLYPEFHAGPDKPLLTFLKVTPRSWVVAEIDARDRLGRQAAVESMRDDRPLVRSAGREKVSLVWIDADAASGAAAGETSDLLWSDVKSGLE